MTNKCDHCGKGHSYSVRACRMVNPTLTAPTEHQKEAAKRALRPHATALNNRPSKMGQNQATEKQVNYVLNLLDRVIEKIPTLREGAVLVRETVSESVAAGAYTKDMASKMIDKMSAELAKARTPERNPNGTALSNGDREHYAREAEKPSLIHLGMYYYGGKAYRAKKSQSSGNFYVEELVLEPKPAFVYARGIVKNITPEHRMSHEQAAMFSRSVGACTNCFRELTANESLRRMYGPICAARNGWPYDTNAD